MRPQEPIITRTISRFGDEAQVVRGSGGYRNPHGEWVEDENVPVALACSVVPADEGRARTLTDSGVALSDIIMIYTRERLVAVAEHTRGDVILYGADRYRVQMVRRWNQLTEALAVKTAEVG